MEENKTTENGGFLQKLYGGIEMSWVKVIALAVISAVITAVFLTVPIFKDTSFERMGVNLEAWFVFAVIIMANCKKPLDSALKTFVFFLISQPLIYLFQVPFSDMGWQIFSFYKTWFIMTLLTFPMAFVGWYIKKRNWLSTLIISPVVGYLTYVGVTALLDTINEPPRLIVTVIFCIAQVVIYILAFTSTKLQKAALAVVAAAGGGAAIYLHSTVSYSGDATLPEGYSYSENAEITVEGDSSIGIELKDPEEGFIHINSDKLTTVSFTIKDGDKKDSFEARIYMENGHTQIKVEAK